MSISLPPQSLINVNKDNYPKNFVFIVDGHEYATNRIFADLISPRASRLHSTDPTASLLVIDVEDPEKHFGFFISLAETGKCDFNPDSFQFLMTLCYELQNKVLVMEILKKEYETRNVDLSNVFDYLSCVLSLIDDSPEAKKVVEFAASHFDELDEDKLISLPMETILLILSDESLRVFDEDSLLKIILLIIQEQGDEFSKSLLCYVDPAFLSVKGITLFLDAVPYDQMTSDIWENIVRRLKFDLVPFIYTSGIQHRDYRNEFVPKENGIFDGIVNYLNLKSGGLSSMNETIEVRSNSNAGDLTFHQLFDYSNNEDKYWSFSSSGGILVIDFKSMKIDLSHYSMRATYYLYGPNTWNVEGSNNNKNWEILDKRVNCYGNFNNEKKQNIFTVQNKRKGSFRYLRICQNGPCANGSNDYRFQLRHIEFFGTIIKEHF